MTNQSAKSSPLLLALVWAIVAVPLGWGLYQSVIKSKPLFAGEKHVAAPSAH